MAESVQNRGGGGHTARLEPASLDLVECGHKPLLFPPPFAKKGAFTFLIVFKHAGRSRLSRVRLAMAGGQTPRRRHQHRPAIERPSSRVQRQLRVRANKQVGAGGWA